MTRVETYLNENLRKRLDQVEQVLDCFWPALPNERDFKAALFEEQKSEYVIMQMCHYNCVVFNVNHMQPATGTVVFASVKFAV